VVCAPSRKIRIKINEENTNRIQIVFWVPANHDIHAFREWPEFFWDTLPCVSAHDHIVLLPIGCVGRYLSKILHFLGQPPWKT
jgi:hypothetical protein